MKRWSFLLTAKTFTEERRRSPGQENLSDRATPGREFVRHHSKQPSVGSASLAARGPSLLVLTLPLALVAAILAWSAHGATTNTSQASGAQTGTFVAAPATAAANSASPTTPAAKAYRAKVVAATKAWLKTLSASQRQTATYSFTDTASKQQWSNFPAFFKPRTGVAYKDMTAASTAAGLALVKVTLSSQGYAQYAGIRKADDYAATSGTGGNVTSGNGNGNFGRNNYYISIFGTPSTTTPFMVAFNGHHLSFNVTFGKAQLGNTPEFVGAEPTKFTIDGKGYQPLKPEATAVFGLLPKLPTAAKLSQSFDDVLVGPQKDGQFPSTQSGVKVSSLPASTQALVTALIASYVNDVPSAIAGPRMAEYKKQYANTYVSYSGATTDTAGAYVRIDGPQAWIEFSVQSTDKGSSHYHSVYRDKKHDYGV
jgi:Protein of unknown function (DUF3500)